MLPGTPAREFRNPGGNLLLFSSDTLKRDTLTSDDLSSTYRIPNVHIRLANLTEYQDDLGNLGLHFPRSVASFSVCDVDQGRRQGIKKALSNEHPTEIILRGRTLELENRSYAVQCMRNKAGVFDIILVEDLNKDLEPTASRSSLNFGQTHTIKEGHTR